MLKNTESNLSKIWSNEFWVETATDIELRYWALIKDKIPRGNFPKKEPIPTEHRIEDFVRRLSKEKNLPNLHVGLTSSDLEDNVRAKRLELSVDYIADSLRAIISWGGQSSIGQDDHQIMAYTHLLPAGQTNIYDRFAPTIDLLQHYRGCRPTPRYRGIRGALGNRHIQYSLCLSDEQLNSIFPGKEQQKYSHQASDHQSDYEVACWIVGVGMTITKLANDIRQMFALQQAHYKKDDVGSTALAHKAPNPWRFERVSGMFTSIVNLPAIVATASASCLLERTLTDQSVLNSEFERSFTVLEGMIFDFIDGMKGLVFEERRGIPCPTSEIELLDLVKQGKGRLEAHQILNHKYNKK